MKEHVMSCEIRIASDNAPVVSSWLASGRRRAAGV
jgi:hypothetical protein